MFSWNTIVGTRSVLFLLIATFSYSAWCASPPTDLFVSTRLFGMTSSNSSAINALRYRDVCAYKSMFPTNAISRDSGSNNESSHNILQWSETSENQIRTCWVCKSHSVFQGVASDVQDGDWVAFFCKKCAPHLSVRRNAQVRRCSASKSSDETLMTRCHAATGARCRSARQVAHRCRRHRRAVHAAALQALQALPPLRDLRKPGARSPRGAVPHVPQRLPTAAQP